MGDAGQAARGLRVVAGDEGPNRQGVPQLRHAPETDPAGLLPARLRRQRRRRGLLRRRAANLQLELVLQDREEKILLGLPAHRLLRLREGWRLVIALSRLASRRDVAAAADQEKPWQRP